MIQLGELIFIGMGLYDEKDFSMRAVEEIKTADKIFIELYTSFMPGLNIQRLEELVSKKTTIVPRKMLEDQEGERILREAKMNKVVLLAPGDPMIATTHVDLWIRAEKMGISTRIIHGASVISAVMGLSGLQNYKFGRSVTVPFPEDGLTADTPYDVIKENKKRGLHTLCFLDIKAEKGRYMIVKNGLEALLTAEEKKKQNIITSDTLVVGIARAGAPDFCIKAGCIHELLKHNFGPPPHTLVFPSKLHFMEAEALVTLAGAPMKIKEMS